MTARIVVSCDGHRAGQPCRGALPTHADIDDRQHVRTAYREAREQAGWRITPDQLGDLCPSRGHDEDQQPHERSP